MACFLLRFGESGKNRVALSGKTKVSRKSPVRRHATGHDDSRSGFCSAIGSLVSFCGCHSLRSEVAMSIFSYRKHLRFLSQAQRRRWWDQKKRLTPRVVVGSAYVPPNVTREFAYVKVG
jgi:hypothetical protein